MNRSVNCSGSSVAPAGALDVVVVCVPGAHAPGYNNAAPDGAATMPTRANTRFAPTAWYSRM